MSLSDVLTVGAVTLFGLAVLGIGLYVAAIGVGRIRTARALGEAGPTALRDVPAANGLVSFAGTARERGEGTAPESAEGTLEAPVTGTPCLAYTVHVRSRDERTDGEVESGSVENPAPDDASTDGVGANDVSTNGASADDRAWTLDGGASASVPFAVEDGTDRVAVDPTNAVLSLDDWNATQSAWTDGSALESDALERLDAVGLGLDGEDDDDSSDSHRRQYRERRLEPGDDVHVFGGSVVDSSERDATRPVTVAGDDWLEISVGDRSTVVPDRRRSGSMYLVFGGLLAVPGTGFTLAGVVGLITTLVL